MPRPRLVLLAWLFLVLGCAALAEPVTLLEGVLTLELPPSFRRLDQAAIEKMFAGSGSVPGVVLVTADSASRLSITHTQSRLAPEELESTKSELKAQLGGAMRWIKDEVVTLNGVPWFRLDFEPDGGPSREIIMGTSARNRLLFLVVSTSTDELDLVEEELEAMIASLQIQEGAARD
jgi:hypothetical protein